MARSCPGYGIDRRFNVTACIGVHISESLEPIGVAGGGAYRTRPIVVDRGRRDDGAVSPAEQGEMPVFAVFVGTILTERMSTIAE